MPEEDAKPNDGSRVPTYPCHITHAMRVYAFGSRNRKGLLGGAGETAPGRWRILPGLAVVCLCLAYGATVTLCFDVFLVWEGVLDTLDTGVLIALTAVMLGL